VSNYLDSLLGRVHDDDLRSALATEIEQLRDQKQFGLVFERHVPETVRLYSHPVRRGITVQERSEHDGPLWTVIKVSRGVAVINRVLGGEVVSETRPVADLVVIREFGQAIYPGLKSVRKVERGGEKPFHAVINAENYHALETLLYAHEGAVDCLYLDPPYNTGAKDWRYNNDYVDGNDVFRHSKWLSFMEKRLLLAKRLLHPDGVLIITIDEKEVHHLGMLLRQVFPDSVRQMTTIVINPLGQARKQELARVEEYAFFVFQGNSSPTSVPDDLLTEVRTSKRAESVRWEWLIRGGTHSLRRERPNLFYPIYVDPSTKTIAEVGETLAADVDRTSMQDRGSLVTVWPLNGNRNEGNWRCSRDYLRELVEKGYARVGAYDKKNNRYSILYLGKAQIRRIESGEIKVVGRDNNNVVQLESDADQRRLMTAKTVWNRPSHRAGEYGSALVKKLLPGRDFPFPKSLYAVRDCLRVAVGDKPDALIVDFFAGSGTTAHAVMLLNAEDGGNRKSICVTNNEVSESESQRLTKQGYQIGSPEWESRGIFEYITQPRVTAAVTGQNIDGATLEGDYLEGPSMGGGFDENVEFLELTYQDRDHISLGRAFEAVAPLLWLKAGAVGSRINKLPKDDAWSLPEDAIYGILFDAQSWRGFVDAVSSREGVKHVFIVTESVSIFQQVLAELPVGVNATHLYEDYLSTFEINTGAGVG
jgi:adenine-specific DNA-methyltransferase